MPDWGRAVLGEPQVDQAAVHWLLGAIWATRGGAGAGAGALLSLHVPLQAAGA